MAEERAVAEQKQAQDKIALQQRARKKAKDTAQEEKQKVIERYTLGAKVLTGCLLCIGIGSCVVSFFSGSIGIVPLIVTIFSALGVWDSIISKKSRIQGKIEKVGNKKEKETFDKELKKLMEVVETKQEQK